MANQRSRIGYLYPYLPPEILYALGGLPVQLLPLPHDLADAEPYVHKNSCALSKMTLVRALAGGESSSLDGVVLADTCDAQRRMFDVWRTYVNIPVLTFLDVARRSDELGQRHNLHSLLRAVDEMQARMGSDLTADALASSIQLYNQQRALWRDLRTAWLGGRVSSQDYYTLRELRLTADPVVANAEIKATLDQAESPPAPSTKRLRLMLMGSLVIPRALVDAVDSDSRAQIVAEDSACGDRLPDDPVPTQGSLEELLQALANHYMSSPAPRSRDLRRRLAYLGDLTTSRQADGVVCSYYKFCDLYLGEFPVVKRFFEARQIPILLLEDEGQVGLSGQARTRLEAFIEMLS